LSFDSESEKEDNLFNNVLNDGIVEAILFYENNIISIEKLIEYTSFTREKIVEIVDNLNEKYENSTHGLFIAKVSDGLILQIKRDYLYKIKEIYNIKGKTKLPKSILTVLSIVAYKQPITKLEIDEIRGVSSDNAIKTLLEKNFIKIIGKKDTLGRPLLYGTADEFLKQFNLKDIKDLPKIDELKTKEFSLDGE